MKQHKTTNEVNLAAITDTLNASDETDTTKSRSTLPTSDSASSSSTLNDEADGLQYDDATLTQLARQLEYYFSQTNLEKDTYVETLRKLNDSYVPVSILQRFQKVKALSPVETIDAILKAATEFSSLLEVASIDAKTGKRVEDDVPGNTLLAIGTISRQPLNNSSLQAVVPVTPTSPVLNTIILREVDSTVTEKQVRALLDDDHCPPIQSLYLDVCNCWFVTLDTTSHDDMLYAMMQLRSQFIGDQPVKARLKSLVYQSDLTHSPGLPIPTPVTSYCQLSNVKNLSGNTNKGKQKKRSKNPTNNINNNNGNRGSNRNHGRKKIGGQSIGMKQASNTEKAETLQGMPDLSAAAFPALSDGNQKDEVVVDVDTDTCSTLTTLSSSLSSGCKQSLTGYAAAVRRAKIEQDVVVMEASRNRQRRAFATQENKSSQARKAEVDGSTNQLPEPSKSAKVAGGFWYGGRSFADVLAR